MIIVPIFKNAFETLPEIGFTIVEANLIAEVDLVAEADLIAEENLIAKNELQTQTALPYRIVRLSFYVAESVTEQRTINLLPRWWH